MERIPEAMNPCAVCGESVRRQPHITLTQFGVYDKAPDADADEGPYWAPDLGKYDPDWDSWLDLPVRFEVHLRCVSHFFEGIHASIPTRRREQLKRQGDE